jgi:hypothetical protein
VLLLSHLRVVLTYSRWANLDRPTGICCMGSLLHSAGLVTTAVLNAPQQVMQLEGCSAFPGIVGMLGYV